jgi:type II secretory pathway pseudopilin PulG
LILTCAFEFCILHFEFMSNRAFTIIELLTVAAIIVLLTGLITPNWKRGQAQFALQRASYKLAQDIRRTQEMALAAQEFQGQIPYAYGVYFMLSEPDHYLIFADLNNNSDYDAGTDGIVEDISLEKGVTIDALSASPLRIAFAPPRPTVAILPAAPAFVRLKNVEISAGSGTKSVCINGIGLINIANSCVANNSPVVGSCNVSCVVGSGSGQCISYTPGPTGKIEVEYNKSVTFTLSGAATDQDGDTLTYHWKWGDGTEGACTLSSCNLAHSYTADSVIKLYVTDGRGGRSGDMICNPPAIKVINLVAGNLVGYAWSENAGWIDFCPNPGGTGPVGSHSGCGEFTGSELRGWAKFVNTGGWISLHCVDADNCFTSNYKVSYNSISKEFSGWAWSEDFGWISFNCADTGVCATSNYKVTLNTTTKQFEGYAWSENLGWIKFNNVTAPSEAINYCVGLKNSSCQ